MSENNPYNTEMYNKSEKESTPAAPETPVYRERNSQSHIWIGFILLLVGTIVFLNLLGIEFPDFLFSWQMLLIGLGLFIGIRKDFQGAAWLILILIGSLFLITDYFLFEKLRKFILPIILIGSGLFFILRPKKSYEAVSNGADGKQPGGKPERYHGRITGQNYIDATSIFGGTKKKVLSKEFKGGDLVNVFGGSEIDLLQADINGLAILEVTAIFGGATLLVPAHWNVVSEAVAILGEVKDKRVTANSGDASRTLVIRGTVIFGGIDIKSF